MACANSSNGAASANRSSISPAQLRFAAMKSPSTATRSCRDRKRNCSPNSAGNLLSFSGLEQPQAGLNCLGLRHRHRLHRHRARGEMSERKNHRHGYFGGGAGAWQKKTPRETRSRSGLNFCMAMDLPRWHRGTASRLFHRKPIGNGATSVLHFDLIISNPPYIPSARN